jgi:hypothetical protein
MIIEEGFVKRVVIYIQIGDNNAGRLVFNHLHTLTFIDALVLGFIELLFENSLLFGQTLHPTIVPLDLVRVLSTVTQCNIVLISNRFCIHGIELRLKLVDIFAEFVDVAFDFE